VHVARERKVAKFWLDPVAVASDGGFPQNELNKIACWCRNTGPHFCRRGMTSSSPAAETAAKRVRVTDAALVVDLQDGRRVSVPLKWYPRLAEGRPSERRRWQLIGPGIGIHWPDLDEDISVEALLLGLPSNESPASLQRWRASRRRPANKRLQPAARPSRSGARRG
jgi:hypothetical protein